MQLKSLLTAYFIAHLRNCISCLGILWREPWNSILTIMVIGIALALPTGLLTLLTNVQQLNNQWQHDIQILVFFTTTTPEQLIVNKQQALQQSNAITTIKYLSPAQALAEFEQYTGQENLLAYLTSNPLPPTMTLYLQPKTPTQELEKIIANINSWPEVTKVQLDQTWLQRLNALLKLGKRLVTIITIVLAMAVFIIICNTIRVDIEKKQNRIIISKLIGATDAFIRREFLYFGFWYGLLGSMITWIIVTISGSLLKGPTQQLAMLYQSNFTLTLLTGKNTMLLFLLAIILGISGAWLAVHKYLAQLTVK